MQTKMLETQQSNISRALSGVSKQMDQLKSGSTPKERSLTSQTFNFDTPSKLNQDKKWKRFQRP